MKDDLISREVARTAVYGYEMQTGIAEMPLEFAHNKIDKVPSVPAVPLDKLCEWLTKNVMIPCRLCDYLKAGRCNTAQNAVKLRCPRGADEWRKVLKKGVEEQDAAD